MNNKSFPIDAKSSNIRPMSFYEFMHCFERGFITLVGEYADQNFESIIRSKMYDIDQLGFCLYDKHDSAISKVTGRFSKRQIFDHDIYRTGT